MKKAIIILTLFMTVTLTVLQPYQAHAVGVDTVVKAVGGKAVIRALAEKMGYSLSKKQLDNTVDFLERKTYDGDPTAIDFMTKANALTGTPSKTGFKKYVLDPMAWITGADLIATAISAFMMGYEEQTPVGLFAMCATNGMENINVTKYPYWVTLKDKANANNIYVIYFTNSAGYLKLDTDNIYRMYNGGSYRQYGYIIGASSASYMGTSAPAYSGSSYTVGGAWNTEGLCEPVPVADDVVNVTNNNVHTIFNNDTYVTTTTYNVEVEVPDTPNYDDVTPWNLADPNLEDELSPPDPNAEPEDKPEHSSWWDWLLGPLKDIADFILGLAEWLLGILIPSAESVTGIFDGISTDFKAKLPIADQLGSFFGEIEKATVADPTAPTFNVTMPEDWGGGTFSIIDFTYFADWRTWILNFIRFAAWFIFLKRLYNRIPKMIY